MKRKLFLCMGIMFMSVLSFSKVGESRLSFEGRLLTKTDGGLQYSKQEERIREMLELPYRNLFLIMPRDVHHAFFYKRSDLQVAQQSDVLRQSDLKGWEIHTIYMRDTIMFESYRKYGGSTMEEISQLMKVMLPEETEWMSVESYFAAEAAKVAAAKKAAEELAKKSEVPAQKIEGVPEIKIENSNESKEKASFDSPIETTQDTYDPKIASLYKMLGKTKERWVTLTVPDAIANSPTYSQTMRCGLINDEQRKLNERYREEQKEKQLQSTSVKMTPAALAAAKAKAEAAKKAAAAAAKTSKITTTLTSSVAESLRESEMRSSRDLKIVEQIPLQDDTAFGYGYITSDGKLRSRIQTLPDGVIMIMFFDIRFDRYLRQEMENMYRGQTIEKETKALDSITKF